VVDAFAAFQLPSDHLAHNVTVFIDIPPVVPAWKAVAPELNVAVPCDAAVDAVSTEGSIDRAALFAAQVVAVTKPLRLHNLFAAVH